MSGNAVIGGGRHGTKEFKFFVSLWFREMLRSCIKVRDGLNVFERENQQGLGKD